MAEKRLRDGAGEASAIDPRARKTREAIVEAFVSLCASRGMEGVSVAAITRLARVNRTTFYRHFEDKGDILERGIGMLLGEIFREIGESADGVSSPGARIKARITRFFEIARERSGLFALLASGRAGTALSGKAQERIDEFMMSDRLGPVGQERLALPLPLASKAFASLLMAMTAHYLDHPGELSAARMADYCMKAAFSGIFADST